MIFVNTNLFTKALGINLLVFSLINEAHLCVLFHYVHFHLIHFVVPVILIELSVTLSLVSATSVYDLRRTHVFLSLEVNNTERNAACQVREKPQRSTNSSLTALSRTVPKRCHWRLLP